MNRDGPLLSGDRFLSGSRRSAAVTQLEQNGAHGEDPAQAVVGTLSVMTIATLSKKETAMNRI